ncbi:MAG: hypothetical protein WA369_13350 [Candidatus Acidiferrales bacterium]
MEFMAAKHDGFVYERTAATARKLHAYRSPDNRPRLRTAQRVKRFLREVGIIGQNGLGLSNRGHVVNGFRLADHDACCKVKDGWCIFQPVSPPCRGHVARMSREIAENVVSNVALDVAVRVAPSTTGAKHSAVDADFNELFGMRSGMSSGTCVGGPESLSLGVLESKTQHDAEPCEKGRPDSAMCSPSQNMVDENERTTREPSDALLTAARVLAKEHGPDGINLAAYICAHAINGKAGEPPCTVSYYTISARDGFLPDGDEDFPKTGDTDHLIHPQMIEDGLDRLRRAAERTDADLYDAIARLEEVHEKIAAREEKATFTPCFQSRR